MGSLGYRPQLDGIRALAIMPVVGLHAFGWPRNGSLGVDLFFVLSGFLITTLLLEERVATGTISFLSFYRRRAARLVPGLAVMLFAYAVATGGAHGWAVLSGATYSTNIVTVLAGGDAIPWSLAHLWSLAQEEQFYLVWPVVLVLLARVRSALFAWIIVLLTVGVILEKFILLATGAGETRIYFGPDTHADPILVGCLAGVLFVNDRVAVKIRFLGEFGLAAVVACVVLSQWTPLLTHISPLRTAFALASAILIYGVLESGAVTRLLGAAALVFVGRISYGLYLWHVPVLAATGAHADGGRPARAALAVCATFAVATTSFFLIEQPFRRRWRQRSSVRAVAVVVQPTA